MTEQTLTFLRALMSNAGAECYLEVRYRRPGGMGQLFLSASAAEEAARVIHGLGARIDVYIGVAPRVTPAGGKSAIAGASVVWADCDTTDARVRLQSFVPVPSLVVRSGSPGACHAYWILERELPPAAVERLNRRLAHALGADAQSVDIARVLRPPGTNNFKHDPPAPVELAHHRDCRVDPRRLDRALPDLPVTPAASTLRSRAAHDDALMAIEPREYVRALLGVEVPRGHKVRCPFHDDATASLHVYDGPQRGWYCYGCGRGGSIYDLAGYLWQLDTRGEGFLTLRKRLHRTFAL